MKNDKLRQFLIVFSFVTLIVMNYLANTGAFGGITNADISRKYHTLITPAGYAFSIWSVIFFGLLAFAIYQALPAQRTNPRLRAVGPWVILNNICNASWGALFDMEKIGVALLVILVMLGSMIMIMETLLVRRRATKTAALLDETIPEMPVSIVETWVARIPYALYFGWLTVATILNITVYFKATGFDLAGLSEAGWAMAILVVGLFVGLFVFNRYRSVAYILAFCWAYAAIAVEQKYAGFVPVVAIVGAMVTALFAVWELFGRKEPVYA